MKITIEDYKKIQDLKRQGFTASQAYGKLNYTQYVICKYWDMPEEQFFEERKTERSPCSKYRDFLIEELKDTHPLSGWVSFHTSCGTVKAI